MHYTVSTTIYGSSKEAAKALESTDSLSVKIFLCPSTEDPLCIVTLDELPTCVVGELLEALNDEATAESNNETTDPTK